MALKLSHFRNSIAVLALPLAISTFSCYKQRHETSFPTTSQPEIKYDEVAERIMHLSSEQGWMRNSSVGYLAGHSGDPRVLPALVTALISVKYDYMSDEMLDIIKDVDKKACVQVLSGLLEHCSKMPETNDLPHYRYISNELLERMGKLDKKAYQQAILKQLNSSPNPKIRENAAEHLGTTPGEGTIAALCGALNDRDEGVVNEVIKSLGKLQDADAIMPLLATIKKSGWQNQSDAFDALGKLEAKLR